MKCTLDGNNGRIVAKAIQSLSKFGNDLFVEADQQGLQLRSINTTQSAIGTFKFNKAFFEIYDVEVGNENYCKIAMKACLTIFRNMRQVERCDIRIIPEQSKFLIQFKCRLETMRNALISIVDEENIQAGVSSDSSRNIICGSHKIFTEISNNFNLVEEEITLEVDNGCLIVKNYIEGTRVNDKFMRSQLKLTSAEFETYKIGVETTITFCLKEFRALLQFAETLNENITLQFDEGGSPVFLRINKYEYVECLLVMSTLSPEDLSFHHDCRESEVTESNCTMPQKRKFDTTSNANTDVSKTRRCISELTTLSNDSSLFGFNGIISTDRNTESIDRPRVGASGNADSNAGSNELIVVAESEGPVTFCDTEDNNVQVWAEGEFIPQSPSRLKGAKLRSIFSRCFESTYVPKEPSPNSQVYVPDSDNED